MITIEQGYCIAYDFLLNYWQTIDKYKKDYNDNSFTLVTIVSTMDPERKNNPSPIDPTKYDDWKNIIKKLYGEKNELTEEEIFNGLIAYLEFFKNNYHFTIQEVIDDILKNINGKYHENWNFTVLNNTK